ncbi:Spy/CpxP family protein refolding chaperone [Methylobacter sp.]|uniref:Spy/CpxP family protein refolding chaperone n=1 Tax=Methylobacter sp. TaxID=2051955 RepID=UPI002FDDF1F2
MRKLLLILSLLPVMALANPHMHDEPSCKDMPFFKHHRPEDGEERLPRFLHRMDLTEKQQTEIKALVKSHLIDADAKMENAGSIGKEIHQLSFSNDYSNVKVQALLDKAAAIHKEMALQKSRLNNAIFKLLTAEQQQKLQSKMNHSED